MTNHAIHAASSNTSVRPPSRAHRMLMPVDPKPLTPLFVSVNDVTSIRGG